MADDKDAVKTYRVKTDDGVWMYGRYYKKGETIDLNDKQAKYHLMDYHIEPVK